MINNKTKFYDEDELCVCENTDISVSERAAIDRVIEKYENGEFKSSDFISLNEFERRIRGAVSWGIP